jgi:hypothetical protein
MLPLSCLQAVTINADEVSPGYNGTDATECLQNALDQVADNPNAPDTVVVRNRLASGTNFWQLRPIFIKKPVILQIAANVTLQAKVNEFKSTMDCLVTVDADDVTIKGAGRGSSRIVMRKSDYQNATLYTPSDFRHCLRLRGVDDFLVQDIGCNSSGGDGILVGTGANRDFCQDVQVINVECALNHRQGMSVVSVGRLTVRNSLFRGTSGTNPEAGVDIEPANDSHRLDNLFFENCQFNNNTGPNIKYANVAWHNLKGTQNNPSPVDGNNPNPNIRIEFKNCSTSGGQNQGIQLGGIPYDAADRPVGGQFIFTEQTVSGCRGHGVDMTYNMQADKNPVVNFNRLRITNPGQAGAGFYPVFFSSNGVNIRSGDVNFYSTTNGPCTINDNRTRPAVISNPASNDFAKNRAGYKDITGSIDVTPNTNDPGTAVDIFGTLTENVTLNVY